MRFIALVFLAAFVLSACAPSDDSSAASKANMKIASFNLRYNEAADPKYPNPKAFDHWNNRRDTIVPMMRYHQVDIFGTQELMSDQIKYLEGKGIYKAAEDFDKVASFLPELKPGHGLPPERVYRDCMGEFDTAKIDASRKRIKPDAVEYRMHNVIFYRPDKFELLEQGSFFLSATPDTFSIGWDTADPNASQMRRCFWAKFKDKRSSRSFYVFNTHTPSANGSAGERLKAAKLILQRVKNIAAGFPYFLTGDFNAEDSEASIKHILSDSEFRDSRAVSETPPYGQRNTFNFWGEYVPLRSADRIDYIFVSPGVRVLDYAVLSDRYYEVYPSDHFPICSRVEF